MAKFNNKESGFFSPTLHRDIEQLSEYILGTCIEMDNSNSMGYSGLYCCNDCFNYENKDGEIKHESDCIVNVAIKYVR